MRALVLSGGGSKGAYQVGVLSQWLGEEKIQYDLFAGVSVGAINAVHLVQYPSGKEREAWGDLKALWSDLTTEKVYKRWFPFGMVHGLWQPALYNSKPLRSFIQKHLDRDKVLRSGKSLRMGVVSLHTGEYRLFDETTEDLVGAVLASASYPLFLLPQTVDGNDLYTDGGVRNVTPLKAAIDAGANEIDVIMTQTDPPRYSPLEDSPNALDIGARVLDIMTAEIVDGDLKQALLYNQLVENNATTDKRPVKIRIVRPQEPLNSGGSLTFDPEKIRGMMAQGQQDAATCHE